MDDNLLFLRSFIRGSGGGNAINCLGGWFQMIQKQCFFANAILLIANEQKGFEK